MRFSAKLFLCILLVLTAALSCSEYYTVSSTLENATEHQVEEALQQHQLVQYVLQSAMLTAKYGSGLNDVVLAEIAEQTAVNLSVFIDVKSTEGRKFYSNTEIAGTGGTKVGFLTYAVRESDEGRFLAVTGTFSQNRYDLVLTTVRDITFVFEESERLQNNCRTIFAVTIIAGLLLTAFLSWILTKPIKKLDRISQKFAAGDYSARLKPSSDDEIGALTRTYNEMAETISEKIAALELAVKQREDFVAGFAHELKTPMTSIIGYADMIYQKDMTAERIHEAAGYILNEGMRLEALSFKLLELITLENQSFILEETDIEQFFADVKESILPAVQKRGIAMAFGCEAGYVRIEYDLFKTMILNLLDNAMKSGAENVRMYGQITGGRYTIEIADDGRGIPKEELKRITEAFYMVDKSRSRKEHGAGLGLALCEKIAAIHGTHIKFKSAETIGTVVTFSVQLCEREDT